MSVRVATVLSAREWESGLVSYARDSAAIRVVARAYQPEDIDRVLGDIDVVVTGGEVSWISPSHLSSWSARGVAVVGVYPSGDLPAKSLLEAGGVAEAVPDSIEVAALVQAIRFAAPRTTAREADPRGRVIGVVGPRGAPGVTEVAVAFALGAAKSVPTILIDLDLDAPSIAVRLGLPPRPDVTDVVDAVRADGLIPDRFVHRYRSLNIVTGSHRAGMDRPAHPFLDGMLRAAASRWDDIVVDAGHAVRASDLVTGFDEVVFVIDGSPLGIVRAAQVVAQWMGPAPALVLNRVPSRSRSDVIDAARHWTGLDPAVVIDDRRRVRTAASAAHPPDRQFSRALAPLGGRT